MELASRKTTVYFYFIPFLHLRSPAGWRPKFHYYEHLLDRLVRERLHPRIYMNWGEESLIGERALGRGPTPRIAVRLREVLGQGNSICPLAVDFCFRNLSAARENAKRSQRAGRVGFNPSPVVNRTGSIPGRKSGAIPGRGLDRRCNCDCFCYTSANRRPTLP